MILQFSRSDEQQTDTDQYQTPEPELASGKSGRPESSSSEQPDSPERQRQPSTDSQPKYSTTSFDQNQSQGWADYDPTQPAWEDEPVAAELTPEEVVNDSVDNENYVPSEESAAEYPNYENYEPVDGLV